jgi:hypothetical protein
MLRRAYIFLAVTGIFAVFLLSANRAYAKSEYGPRSGISQNAALTTNPLLSKGDPWLSLSVPVPARNAQGSFSVSLRSREKSLKLSKSTLTSMQSWFCFRTIPLSLSTLNHALPSSLNCLTANQEIGEVSNDGDLFTAKSPWSNGKSEPAERRVLSFDSSENWEDNGKLLNNMTETSRGKVWKEIAFKPAIGFVTVPWVIMGGFNLVKSEWLSRELQDKWQLRILNPWPWWAWSLISSAILIVVILESSYRVIRERESETEVLREDLQKQTKAARDADANFIRRSNEIITLQGLVQNKQVEIESVEDSLKLYYELCGDMDSMRFRVIRLAHDIYRFLEEKGPVPEIPSEVTPDERQKFIVKFVMPFSQTLNGGFKTRFSQKLIWARDELEQAGFF